MRACNLGIINAAYSWKCLPWLWCKVPIAPIPKPGKDPTSFDGYRSVYLLAALFKLYDKMLFDRINPKVKRVSESWQAGGNRGADQTAWLLDQLLRSLQEGPDGRKTWVAFLDAEAAYCRPPRPCILKGLARAGISYDDWLAIQSILVDIKGCVKVAGTIVGEWDIESGAYQGGSLSSPLFQSTLPELEEELRANGCGVQISNQTVKRCWFRASGTSMTLHYLQQAPEC